MAPYRGHTMAQRRDEGVRGQGQAARGTSLGGDPLCRALEHRLAQGPCITGSVRASVRVGLEHRLAQGPGIRVRVTPALGSGSSLH